MSVRLNLRGVQCPFVLAEIATALEEAAGDGLEVECDDDVSVRRTVPAFCQARGYQCLVEELGGPTYRIRIQPSSA